MTLSAVYVRRISLPPREPAGAGESENAPGRKSEGVPALDDSHPHPREESILDGFRDMACTDGVRVKPVMRAGDAIAEISRLAHATDLVILDQGERDSVLGMVALSLLRHVPRPFLLASQPLPLQGPILVAYDGSWGASRALSCAAEIAHRWKTGPLEIVLVSVVQNMSDTIPNLGDLESYLDDLGVPSTTEAVISLRKKPILLAH